MSNYKSLKVLSYEKRNDIENFIRDELYLRKNKYTSIFTGFYINPMFKGEKIHDGCGYELFCNMIEPIRILCEDIYDKSLDIKEMSAKIPAIARGATINRLIVNEIQSTNEIEGVVSSKDELRLNLSDSGRKAAFRHKKIVESYVNIFKSSVKYFNKVSDLRDIYDSLFEASDTIDDYVESDLFRLEPVYIKKSGNIVHTGVGPENIEGKLLEAIDFVNRRDVNFMVKMSIFHYMLEYIHPFYDGNGRLGRYLMSVYLKRKLDIYTAISVSYSINQNKRKYEKLFLEVTDKKNYGDLTLDRKSTRLNSSHANISYAV